MTGAFSAKVAAFAEMAKDLTDETIGNVVGELFSRIVVRSPVGNPSLWEGKAPKYYVGGTFRANWRVTYGEPETVFLTREKGYFPIQNGEEAIATIEAGRGQRTWQIYNNAPYGLALEYGHSTQRPTGLVKLTVMEFPQILVDAVMKAREGAQ